MNENVTKCYFYILSFPERKQSGGSGISNIIAMVICFSWNFKNVYPKCVFGSFWNVITFSNIFVYVTVTKNRVLSVTTLFFWKFCENFWCNNNPNAHIRTFWKHWSFIRRCFSLWVPLNDFCQNFLRNYWIPFVSFHTFS